MARYFYIVTLLSILFSSCEDVIEVDVPIDEPRLVLDALIRVDTTQEFVDVKIKVTKTNAFFDNVEVVSDLQNRTRKWYLRTRSNVYVRSAH